MFGYVAHHRDFFDEFLTSDEGKTGFLRQATQHSCHGDPTFTFSDVGRALQTWLVEGGILAKYGVNAAIPTTRSHQKPSTDLAMLEEFKAAYRSQNLRPVRGFFFVRRKRSDLACPLVALALHQGVADRADLELARDGGMSLTLEWAAETFGEEWAVGLLEGFDVQTKASKDPAYKKGFEFGTALADEILPGERIC